MAGNPRKSVRDVHPTITGGGSWSIRERWVFSGGGPAPSGFPVTFTWRAGDPDAGDRLTYMVRVLFERERHVGNLRDGMGLGPDHPGP